MHTTKVYWLSLAAGLGLAACSSNKPENKPVVGDAIVQAEQLIAQQKSAEAKVLLEGFIAKKPADWAPRMEVQNKVTFVYWDVEHRNECYMVDVLMNKDKTTEAVVGGAYPKAYYLLADIALAAGESVVALAQLDKGLALEPTSASLLAGKASVYEHDRRFEKALEYFRKAVSLDSCVTNAERGRAYRGFGVGLAEQGDLDEAEKSLELSLKFSPNKPETLTELKRVQGLKLEKVKATPESKPEPALAPTPVVPE